MIVKYIYFILGAIISLFLYACIIVGKSADESMYIEETEKDDE